MLLDVLKVQFFLFIYEISHGSSDLYDSDNDMWAWEDTFQFEFGSAWNDLLGFNRHYVMF